jgi:hypothetical protein
VRWTCARAVAGLALVTAAVAPAVVAAEPDARALAQAKLAEGSALLDKHDAAGALERFEQAYALAPSASFFFEFGLAYEALGKRAKAVSAFARFLAEAPDRTPASVLKSEQEISALRPQVAALLVTCDTAGSTITVDGEQSGTAPLGRPLYLDPGDHEVVAASGDRKVVHNLTLAAGQVLKDRLELPPPEPVAPVAPVEPAAAPLEPATLPAASAPAAAAAPALLEQPETPSAPAPPPARDRRRVAAWTTGGLAGAALVVGIVADSMYVSKVSAFNAPSSGCAAALPGRGGLGCADQYDSLTTTKDVAVGGLVSAAVLAASSAVLLILSRRRPAP